MRGLLKLWVRFEVSQHRIAGWVDDPVHHEFAQPLLDAADLRSRRDLADAHDVLAIHRRRQTRGLFVQDQVEPRPELVELLRVWISRGGDVGPGQRYQPRELRTGVAGEAAHSPIGPLL